MSIPVKLPEWASTTVEIVEPSEGRKDEGWVPGQRPPAGYFNWLWNLGYKWFSWLWSGYQAAYETLGANTPSLGNAYGSPSDVALLVAGRSSIANAQAEAFGFSLGGQPMAGVRCGHNGKILVCGEASFVAEGDETAETWSKNALGSGDYYCAATSSLAGSPGVVLVAGDLGVIETAPDNDLTDWTTRTAFGGYNGQFRGAAYNLDDGIFAIVGSGAEIQTTANLSTYVKHSPRAGFAGDFNAVIYNPAREAFYAGGTGGELEFSSSGVTWTRLAAGLTSNAIVGLCHDGERMMAVVEDTGVLISDNGTDWTLVPVAGFGTPNVNGCFYQQGLWYVFGDSDTVWVSPDRLCWAKLAVGFSPNNRNYRCGIPIGPVTFEPQRFAMVSSADTGLFLSWAV